MDHGREERSSRYFAEVGKKMESTEHNARIKIKINIYSFPILFCGTEFM